MILKRFPLALLALLLLLVPILAGGSPGGEGGWINVPGGGGGGWHQNGAATAPRVETVCPLGHGIGLRFMPEMEGAVAWIIDPATGSVTTMATTNATLVLAPESLAQLVRAGVRSLLVMVVAPSQVTVNVTIALHPENGTAVVQVW